ncbi:alpha-L RNA-binding motif-containing protein [Rostrohypoxylon terebratum]|nr:alpha-L RNA-binding motif-containing protein [Rostrohypoxylon terebratum]
MKPKRYHGLYRPKLRQSWNKYNLFNIARFKDPKIGWNEHSTFFQQKWKAKGMLRAYHGEHVVERKWARMFSRRLLGVVDMNAKYMAQFDGSELAAGRGSGRDKEPLYDEKVVSWRKLTPYMQMTFAPMERRLDIAVFRAMFASSARQARQFVVHGAVKVNGKVMPYPAYRLNPGDMFQVDPERVLLATGAPKPDATKKKKKKKKAAGSQTDDAEGEEEASEEAEEAAEESSEPEQDPDTTDKPEAPKVDMRPTREQIMDIAARAKAICSDEDVSGAQKQRLRAFVKQLRSLVSRAGRPSATPAEIAEELSAQLGNLSLAPLDPAPARDTSLPQDPILALSKKELEKLEARIADQMREEKENPFDPSKPYATPWRPRDYMAPFAFIPKYLEVNHNICSAVYLRHPVAKVGRGEVPTPFPESVNQLAFNWYLRRR